MDGNDFDAFVRSLHSRRGVIWTLAGMGAGVGLTRGAEAARKKKGGGESRFGCTKHDNSCSAKATNVLHCPDAPPGTEPICLRNNKRKPVCAASGNCFPCKRKADCVAEFGPTAKCIKKCPACQTKEEPTKSICIIPFRVHS